MQGNSRTNDWFDERVEAFVDGDLTGQELLAFRERLDDDERLREQVRVAERITSTLGEAPTFTLPESMVRQAQSTGSDSGRSDVSKQTSGRGLRLIQSPRFVWTSVAAAAAIVFAVVLFPTQTQVQNFDNSEPTQAEVERALAEVKWTLALVSDIGNEREDIVNGHIVAPVQKAMSFVIVGSDETQGIQ